MTRTLIVAAGAILAATSLGSAQPSALTFHDLSTMARHPLGRMQARGATGRSGSIMITELPPGLKTTPHHHHQEQVMLGLGGGMHYLMGGKPYPLGRLTAAIALPNVEHGNLNETAEGAMCIEYQPVLRPDWFPPHPRRAREGAPAPVPVPADRRVTDDLTPASTASKSLTGDTVRLTVWDLSKALKPVELTAGPAVERFVYVIDGSASVAEGATEREIGREMLVIVSASAKNVRVSSPKKSGLIAVFEPIK